MRDRTVVTTATTLAFGFVLLLVVTATAASQRPSRLSIMQACAAVGMRCDYDSRIRLLDLLLENGKVVIPDYTNPPSGSESGGNRFIGTPLQNDILARNILYNRHLFQNGGLSAEAAKKWVVVP